MKFIEKILHQQNVRKKKVFSTRQEEFWIYLEIYFPFFDGDFLTKIFISFFSEKFICENTNYMRYPRKSVDKNKCNFIIIMKI